MPVLSQQKPNVISHRDEADLTKAKLNPKLSAVDFDEDGKVFFMTLDRARSSAEFVFARASRLYPVYWLSVLMTAAAVTACNLPV